jgi:hypothetical protein
MNCPHCESVINPKLCEICDEIQNNECFECHLEIVHGIIIPGTNIPCCGNAMEYPKEDEKYFPVIPSIIKSTWTR